MLSIVDHKLQNDSVRHLQAADYGGKIVPRYIIMHYTGSGSQRGSDDWLSKMDSIYVSAHLTIGRDGAVTQLVPFDTKAFHAGVSRWDGLEGMNKHSIGIELINWGKLSRNPAGEYITWTGAAVPNDQVVEAVHKHETQLTPWQSYTQAQIGMASLVCALIKNTYDIKEIIGHDDIAPTRKVDPGPLFDWVPFRACVERLRVSLRAF